MTRRLRQDDGSNAVEFALLLPVLLLLIFGAITAGLTLNTKQQLDHAAREGARYGATLAEPVAPATAYCTSPDRSYHECVRDHVLGTSVGAVKIQAGGRGGVCVSLILDSAPLPDTWLYGNVEDSANVLGSVAGVNTTNPCFVENPGLNGDRVQVKAIAPGRLDAVFFRTAIFDLTSRSVSRYEAG